MRQLVSLVKDGRVSYALADDETGQLVPFAEIVLPHPDHFGLGESAALGNNLIQAIGLNGVKRGPGRPPTIKTALPPGFQPALLPGFEPEEEEEKPAPPPKKPRVGRPTPRPYIDRDMVLAVIAQYPEGISIKEIAERVARQLGVPGGQWAIKAVSNRFTAMEQTARQGKGPLPYRSEHRPYTKADGTPSATLTSKYVMPLGKAL